MAEISPVLHLSCKGLLTCHCCCAGDSAMHLGWLVLLPVEGGQGLGGRKGCNKKIGEMGVGCWTRSGCAAEESRISFARSVYAELSVSLCEAKEAWFGARLRPADMPAEQAGRQGWLAVLAG